MPLHRAGDITYYEELGVGQDAPPEQVRDAYRALVRLLHPDQQTDQQLKDIAELQMRKLNRIYSVLSDPERRRQYDQMLRGEALPPTIIFRPAAELNLRRLMSRFAWIGAVVVSVLFLIWLASEGSGGPQVQAFERGLAMPGTQQRMPPISMPGGGDPAEDISQLRTDLRIARAERDAAIRELTRLRGSSGPANSAESGSAEAPPPAAAPTVTTTEMPAASKSPVPASSQPAHAQSAKVPPAPPRQFAGFWFYTRPPLGQHNQNHALYPPEFIEATITEVNGMVVGKYRSRYQIADRAISPDVNFEFSGTPTAATMACPWSGPGGSRGELTIRMTGENTLRIDWTANELGNAQGLASGTAILSRRVE